MKYSDQIEEYSGDSITIFASHDHNRKIILTCSRYFFDIIYYDVKLGEIADKQRERNQQKILEERANEIDPGGF